MLHKLGSWSDTYLLALRDVVRSPIIAQSFKRNKGFQDSLLRSSGAEIALADAPNLFSPIHHGPQTQESVGPGARSQESDRLAFALETTVGGNIFQFSVGLGLNVIAERCAVVIGYNAVGKTKLLANIGMIASRKPGDPDELRIRKHFGQFLGNAPRLSGVLAVSYSAFDTFEIPKDEADADTRSEKEERISAFRLSLPTVHDDGGPEAVRLELARRLLEAALYGVNYWETAMLSALAASDVYCSGGFNGG